MSSRNFKDITVSRDNVEAWIRQGLQQFGHKEDIVSIQYGALALDEIPMKILFEEPEVKQFKLNGESS